MTTKQLHPQVDGPLFAAVLLLLRRPMQIEEVDRVFQLWGLSYINDNQYEST